MLVVYLIVIVLLKPGGKDMELKIYFLMFLKEQNLYQLLLLMFHQIHILKLYHQQILQK